jgi:glycosyltransferase involved in cell wall biosynthesis
VFRHRLYYGIKPLVPLSARLAVRRWFALRKRDKVQDVWPILPGSERPPEGWAGWPEGKQFAFVLTHDVEGPAGLAKVRKLMALEQKFGFRSAFNLIPEGGQYAASKELRDELAADGFEVGVHDLYHDGKLFLTRSEFSRNAVKINQYLKDWGAAGFRSGFMLRNLDWIHDLNVQYDASTFDTDPFEPQPQGQHTIFPFWVPRPAAASALRGAMSAQGYVELPYTLAQDSTLFLLLRERHADIWFQKLDWIAKHGGMALVDVHPDYVRFEGEANSGTTYPVEMYARFLDYARERHGNSFWHANPGELGRWYKGALDLEQPKPRPVTLGERSSEVPVPARPRRICMVTYSNYEADNRVMRYAEELARQGDTVEILAIKSDPSQADTDMVGLVKVSRIQSRQRKDEKTRANHLLPILRFLIAASVRLVWRQLRRPYDLVHVHNVPDFLVFAAWLPKLAHAKIILDIHDILPEFYASKFRSGSGGFSMNMLMLVERTSARFADHVIISNDLWRDKYCARTGVSGRCSVFINNVDTAVFRPRMRTRSDGKLILLFPGGLQWHQGLDIGIRAFKRVAAELPNAEFHIYGGGIMKGQLEALTQELGLEPKVRFFKPLPLRRIAEIMANADLGVVPKRADSFGNEAYSTKIMEFMSVGVPVVVSRTKIDSYYFDDSVVRFFEPGNHDALAQAMLDVLRDAGLRHRLVANASAYAAEHSWSSRKQDYLSLVDRLVQS